MATYLILKRRRQLLKKIFSVQRPLRYKGNWADLSDTEFVRRFRLDKSTFMYLCDTLRPKLERTLTGYPVEFQVLSTLKLLGTGSFQSVVADDLFTASSQSTVSRNVNSVCSAVFENLQHFISFPQTAEELKEKKEGFYTQSFFPDVVGCIDCTHIPIQKPSGDDSFVYMIGKKTYSINIQLVCDSDMRIIDLVARWPGSVPDFSIWDDSGLRRLLSSEDFQRPNYLLGDNRYPLEPWLLTPYANPTTPEEKYFNEKLESLHSIIGRCIRVLKSRFRCLHKRKGGLGYSPAKVCKIVFVAAILHNLCISRCVNVSEIIDNGFDEIIDNNYEDYGIDDIADSPSRLPNEAAEIRAMLAQSIYS